MVGVAPRAARLATRKVQTAFALFTAATTTECLFQACAARLLYAFWNPAARWTALGALIAVPPVRTHAAATRGTSSVVTAWAGGRFFSSFFFAAVHFTLS